MAAHCIIVVVAIDIAKNQEGSACRMNYLAIIWPIHVGTDPNNNLCKPNYGLLATTAHKILYHFC